MKLIIAIVQNKDAGKLRTKFVENNIMATKLASSGSFLKTGNVTYLLAVQETEVEKVLEIIKENCSTRQQYVSPTSVLGIDTNDHSAPYEVQVGGATVMILPIEAFHQF